MLLCEYTSSEVAGGTMPDGVAPCREPAPFDCMAPPSQRLRAEAGRGWPRLAEAGRGWPRLAEAGRGWPRRAEAGRGGPRLGAAPGILWRW